MTDKATTTPKKTAEQPSLESLRARLAPRTRPEPTAEQKDKEARTVAVQSAIANLSDTVVSFLGFEDELTKGGHEIDDEVVDHVRLVYKHLEAASKAAVAGVRAIPATRYESAIVGPDDL